MRVFITFYAHEHISKLNLEGFPPKAIRIGESFHCSRIYYEDDVASLEEVQRIIQRMTAQSCKCVSVKIFSSGKLPDMKPYGFLSNNVFYMKNLFLGKREIAMSCVPYGRDEWCFMLENRRSGIPPRILREIPYFTNNWYQMQWEVEA